MRQLGLKTSTSGQVTAAVALLGVVLAGMSCTRTANQEPVPPSASAGAQSSSAPAPSVQAAPPEAAATESQAAAQADKIYDDTTRTIAGKVGDKFTINLPANITTPYKWVVDSPESVVALTERHYEEKPPVGCTNCVGYPGTDRLTFEAKSGGTATLVLRYAPLRSKTDPAERELSIEVTIAKP